MAERIGRVWDPVSAHSYPHKLPLIASEISRERGRHYHIIGRVYWTTCLLYALLE